MLWPPSKVTASTFLPPLAVHHVGSSFAALDGFTSRPVLLPVYRVTYPFLRDLFICCAIQVPLDTSRCFAVYCNFILSTWEMFDRLPHALNLRRATPRRVMGTSSLNLVNQHDVFQPEGCMVMFTLPYINAKSRGVR